MTAQSFTYSGNVYTGAAPGTVDFALTSTAGNPILYLENAHIHVYKSVNQGSSWTELSRPAGWDFVNSGTVARLTTGTTAGDWIKVQRITPSTSSYVTFQASSLLTAEQLNDDTLFNTYLNQERFDQGEQSSLVATNAETAANAATAAATAATTASNTATSTANTALANSTTAINTANASAATAGTALTNSQTSLAQSSSAVSTSNSASASAASAVTTANSAASNAATALTNSQTALTQSANAVTTANQSSTAAGTALANSQTALSQSSSAVTTANAAATDAATALTNSQTALTQSSSATTTANSANSKADQAIAVVGNSVLYELVANVAAIPASPANNKAVEIYDSTGIESFTPLANKPAGFVGSSGLSVRIIYSTSGSTWNWVQYFPNDPETRYLKFSGGTLTGQLLGDDSTSAATPGFAFDGDPDTGIGRPGANELALITGGVARLTFDSAGAASFANSVTIPAGSTVTGYLTTADASSTYLTQSSAASTYAPLASPTFTGTVTIPAGASIDGYLTTAAASSTYQTQAGMSSYLTTSAAGSTYAPLASPTFTGTVTIPAGASIDGYLTTATASSTYQTQAGMSSYLTTSSASSTYQTQAAMSSYLTTSAASSTYAPQASPTFTGAPYVNGSYRGNVTAMAALSIDCSLGNYFTKTINSNSTFTVTNVPSSRSYAFTLELTHTSGSITWFNGVIWPGGTAPSLATNRVHLFIFQTDNAGTTWRASSIPNYLS